MIHRLIYNSTYSYVEYRLNEAVKNAGLDYKKGEMRPLFTEAHLLHLRRSIQNDGSRYLQVPFIYILFP